jgi:RNA 3'-terminal phosphate cyclase (ATP)
VSESLPEHIGERQASQVMGRLRQLGLRGSIEQARWPTLSGGTAVFLRAVFSRSVAGFSALGERGKPAETVADEAIDALNAYLHADGAIDPHAADQMLTLLALPLEPSRYTTTRITQHLLTNAEIVRQLTGRNVTIEGALDKPGRVYVEGQ